MRNAGTTLSSAPAASRDLAHQFVQCYSWPARGLRLLREHPHILSSQTRLLLERDAAWLLFPTIGGGGPGLGGAGESNQQHRDRAFGLIRAAALLEMCAGRPRHELRQRLFALARSCQATCREHQARAEAIYLRVRRRWDEDQRTRRQAAAAARRRRADGRGIRTKARRGSVTLGHAQRQLDRERLARMSFDELREALHGMTLEEREAALDQITQVRTKTLSE